MAVPSFIFGGNTGVSSPEELARRREIQNALTARILGHAPQNVGEGLSAIGEALAVRRMRNRNDAAAKAGQDSANAAFSPIVAALGGAGAFPAAPGAPAPASSAAPTDYPSQRVSQAFGDGQDGFIQSILPKAMEASKATGVDPRIIVAQAALESGYGKHAPGNNLFGIKGGNGPALATKEVIDGQPVNTTAQFRQYASPADSVQGYADFINSNPRYGDLKSAQGLDAQLQALGASGYATDPAYAAKVGSIARGIQLPQTATDATQALAAGQMPAPALPPAQNVPDMPVAGQPVQVAQNANRGQMSDAQALQLLGAEPVKPGQGATVEALVKAASNPFLNKNQSAIVQALLQQKMKASDPGTQLDMRYKQAQLNALEHPQAKPTSDMQNYEFYTAQEKAAGRQPLSYNDWNLQSKKAGATTINNNVSAGGDFSKQLQKNVADNVLEQRAGAQDAADLIKIINEGRGLLDQGAITGAGANYKVGALKFAGALGIPIPQDAADNTQAFRAVMGQAVGKIIKQFGSGTGLSDADRQYAERIAGGDVTLNEEAIRRILDIADKGARGRIKAWQTKLPEVMKGDLGSMLDVQMPGEYQAPQRGGQTSGGLQWSIEP